MAFTVRHLILNGLLSQFLRFVLLTMVKYKVLLVGNGINSQLQLAYSRQRGSSQDDDKWEHN